MKRIARIVLLVLLSGIHQAAAQDGIAVRAERVYTMAGEALENGVVLIRDGKIERTGSNLPIPQGYEVIEGKVATPGLIDAHTVVGLAGYLNQAHDQDILERSNPIQPELRAIDAYNGREELVGWLRRHGITTMHTGHGPGALVSGQTMLVKTVDGSIDEALIHSPVMLAMTLGPAVSNNFQKPGTRAKGIAMLRESLIKAQDYARKMESKEEGKRPARDLSMEMLSSLLKGEVTALVTAHRVPEILAALRLQKEFGFRMVLDGASESYLLLDEIKSAGVPVFLHPSMMRPGGDAAGASLETAARLRAAGIPFALQSGYESYVPKTRVVLFEAAIYAANGLSFDEALSAITIDAARILGIDRRVGSLEAGKDADVVVFDGDPFEYTSRVCKVVLNGQLVSDECW